MIGGDLEPAHPRWSSEKGVQLAGRRLLVWRVGVIESLVGKGLEQLRATGSVVPPPCSRSAEEGIRP